jgi:hypothetical protein
VHVVLDTELGAMGRRAGGADGVQAAEYAADVAAVLGVQLVERATEDAVEVGRVSSGDARYLHLAFDCPTEPGSLEFSHAAPPRETAKPSNSVSSLRVSSHDPILPNRCIV